MWGGRSGFNVTMLVPGWLAALVSLKCQIRKPYKHHFSRYFTMIYSWSVEPAEAQNLSLFRNEWKIPCNIKVMLEHQPWMQSTNKYNVSIASVGGVEQALTLQS